MIQLAAARAQHFDEKAPLFAHMRAVNANWQQDWLEDEVLISFASSEDRIQRHLFEAHKLLSKQVELNPNRAALLASLYTYAEERQFPKNTQHPFTIPYFIDEFNTPCAVANLMLASNDKLLAGSINTTHNFDYLHSMPSPLVNSWAKTTGFEPWELALIQPAYEPGCPPVRWIQEDELNLNGTVHKVTYDAQSENLCVAGSFNTDNGSCFMCVNNGVEVNFEGSVSGLATDFEIVDTRFFVAGNFSSGRGFAISDGGAFSHLNLDGVQYKSHAIARSGRYIYFDAYYEAHDSSHVFKMHIDSSAARPLFGVNGNINDIVIDLGMVIAAGHFTAAYLLGSTFPCQNFIALTPSAMSNMECRFIGEVFKVRRVDDLLYVAGDCTYDSTDTSSCMLANDNNGNWHHVLDSATRFAHDPMFGGPGYKRIHELYEYKDTLFVGGDIHQPMGSRLFYLEDNILIPNACFNDAVLSMSTNEAGQLLSAGAFTQSTHGAYYGAPSYLNSTATVKYVALKADDLSGIEDQMSHILKVYPNPSTTQIQIEGLEGVHSAVVFDLSGKMVDTPIQLGGEVWVNVTQLPSGLYVLEATLRDQSKKRVEFLVQR